MLDWTAETVSTGNTMFQMRSLCEKERHLCERKGRIYIFWTQVGGAVLILLGGIFNRIRAAARGGANSIGGVINWNLGLHKDFTFV